MCPTAKESADPCNPLGNCFGPYYLYSAGGLRHTGRVVVCLCPARLSQDLAKDLAILAREIHDVAGEGEPPSSATEAQVPDATMTAHEEVPRTASKTPARHPASAPDSFCIALSPRYSLKGVSRPFTYDTPPILERKNSLN